MSTLYRGPYDIRTEVEGLKPISSTMSIPAGFQGKLLFTDGNAYILHLETGECHHYEGVAGMMNPCWHPDGIWFACGEGNIYLINSQVGQFINATPNRLHNIHARWSPDGKQIILARNAGFAHGGIKHPKGLFLMDSQTLALTHILIYGFQSQYHPAWSPDGKYIVFAGTPVNKRFPQLFVIDTDCIKAGNCDPIQITKSPQGQCQYPRWSPDGKQIVFETNQDNGTWAIYVMNSNGSNPKRITFNSDKMADGSPCWSPDGRWIAFARSEIDPKGERVSARNIFIMRPDGSDIKRITTDGAAHPDWWMDLKQGASK